MAMQAPFASGFSVSLYAADGLEVVRSGGSLMDLLAAAGAVDAEGMTVMWHDGNAVLRILPLQAAIAQELTETDKAELVKQLKARAKSYTVLSEQLKALPALPDPAPVPEQTREEAIAEAQAALGRTPVTLPEPPVGLTSFPPEPEPVKPEPKRRSRKASSA